MSFNANDAMTDKELKKEAASYAMLKRKTVYKSGDTEKKEV
jgi:hypothetical protein